MDNEDILYFEDDWYHGDDDFINTPHGKRGKSQPIFCIGGKPSKFWNGVGRFKNKASHPYSYDPICIWGDETKGSGEYTDRLWQWDHKKHDRLCKKHFGDEGQYWNRRDPEKIEAFLRDYHDDPTIKLTFITEFCNVSNGYPTWLLGFTHDG